MGIGGSFLGVERLGEGGKSSTRIHIVPRLIMSGTNMRSLHVFMECTGTKLPFLYVVRFYRMLKININIPSK